MDFYGWRTKLFKFNAGNVEQKRQECLAWIEKWKNKYQIREILVCNAWAVEYRLLLK